MIENESISYQKSGYFSKLILDYLDQKPELSHLYNHFPTIENFKFQIEEKATNFPNEARKILVEALENQNKNIAISEKTKNNIALLANPKTFTITTGHQLNLFTGPLYFFYKIVSTINLCKELKITYPDFEFVPVYWMATEDHDFEEINHFNFKNTKINWTKESHGPVGRLSTEGLNSIFEKFSNELGVGKNADFLKNLFQKSYLENNTLADSTRFLVNELFKKEGLVILDGDDKKLKKQFIPFLKDELLQQSSFKKVTETNTFLEKNYQIQVNPREINLFYLDNNLRERIIFTDNVYKVNNTTLSFSETEIIELLQTNPEKFSPNVILRPLYQEVVLPNLCYIGGGGEIAYWLQIKEVFKTDNVTFPILLLRNSVLLCSKKQFEKATKLNLSLTDLFSNQQELFIKKTREYSNLTIDFTNQKEFLKTQFKALYELANQTDKSFIGAVKAQEIKQLKGIDRLEKRLLKAEKRVHSEKLERVLLLQNELFPNQVLQERKNNFSEFYLDINDKLIEKLFQELKPLEPNFTIITF